MMSLLLVADKMGPLCAFQAATTLEPNVSWSKHQQMVLHPHPLSLIFL